MAQLICPLAIVAWPGGVEAFLGVVMLVPLLFFLFAVLYLWRLLLAAVPGRSKVSTLAPMQIQSGARIVPDCDQAEADIAEGLPGTAGSERERLPHFVVLIPAHNEEMVLGAALESLKGLDYPRDSYRIVVIADNCTDRTPAIALACGVEAEERHDLTELGKGYALAWMLERLISREQREGADGRLDAETNSSSPNRELTTDYDAIVILDADTLVAPNLLRVFADKLRSGDTAIQARYEVLNAAETWRTRLMSCALALAHIVKPMGRERLSLSDGLKGNGMCFARAVVESVPWSGNSITEDIEYTIRLCLAGFRVAFAPETAVWAQMPTTAKQSASQRRRWEGGRYRLISEIAPGLMVEAIKRRSRILLDRAMELVIPPFAEMFAGPCILLIVSVTAAHLLHSQLFALLSYGWAMVLLLQAGYLVGGMWMAKIPFAVAVTALYAPGYILWKFGLYGAMLVQRSAGGWKRTERRKLGS